MSTDVGRASLWPMYVGLNFELLLAFAELIICSFQSHTPSDTSSDWLTVCIFSRN